MLLRPHQTAALEGVQAVYRTGRRRALLVAPTGFGKSALTRHMLGRTTKRSLILCHRENLRDMISGSLDVPHGVIGERGDSRAKIQVGMMQTVSRRLDKLQEFEFVISDEAHLAMCATWRRILQHYGKAWHLGLSATPCREDGQGLGAEYSDIVYGMGVRELTARGYLVPLRLFAPPIQADLPMQSGKEFNTAADAAALDKASITGDVIEHWRRLASGKLTLGFCGSRDHAKHCAEQFRGAGIPAAHVDGSMPKSEQDRILADFAARRILVLFNVDLLTTGFDCPQIECLLLLRRTKSLALFLQMIGRALRTFLGKSEAVIIDHVGNLHVHGHPDADREWTLDGRPQRSAAATVLMCPKCYAAHRPTPRCPSCDYVYATAVARARKQIEQREGKLEEIVRDEAKQFGGRSLQEALKHARSLGEDDARHALTELQRALGYKPGWVMMQMQLRRRFRLGAGMRRSQLPASEQSA